MILTKIARKFTKNTAGVTAIEYAIVGVAVAALVATVFGNTGTLKTAFDDAFGKISTSVKG